MRAQKLGALHDHDEPANGMKGNTPTFATERRPPYPATAVQKGSFQRCTMKTHPAGGKSWAGQERRSSRVDGTRQDDWLESSRKS